MVLLKISSINLFLTSVCLVLNSIQGNSQHIRGFERLQAEAKKQYKYQTGERKLNSINVFDSAGNLNYITPLLILLANKDTLVRKYGSARYYDNIATLLSFIGDFRNALSSFSKTDMPAAVKPLSKETMQEIRNTAIVPFEKFLEGAADTNMVIMINEAHHRPLHRMNVAGILDLLYERGYRTLAVEALSNYKPQSFDPFIPGASTGYYPAEPNMSELLRHAVKIGFRLLPYEINLSSYTNYTNSNIRDSVQANNILDTIRIGPDNKLLVYAGYGHIDEGSSMYYTSMAVYFKSRSGINPLTIDQTRFLEGDIKTKDVLAYEQLLATHKIKGVGIPLSQGKPYLVGPFTDIALVFPQTTYKNARPDWLFNSRLKKEYRVEVPSALKKKAFLVQAYYTVEVSKKDIEKLVPADQTYDSDQSYYSLYLHPANYTIVIRDIENKVIFSEQIKFQ